jgi:hypothetical protein
MGLARVQHPLEQARSRHWPHNPIHGEPIHLLKAFHRQFCGRAKDPIHHHSCPSAGQSGLDFLHVEAL